MGEFLDGYERPVDFVPGQTEVTAARLNGIQDGLAEQVDTALELVGSDNPDAVVVADPADGDVPVWDEADEEWKPGPGGGDVESETARAIAAEAALSGQVGQSWGIVDRNVDGTWPARPSGFKSVYWRVPVGVDRGAWVSGTSYAQDDVVTSGAAGVFQRITAGAGTTAPPAANWRLITSVALDELVYLA